MLGLPYTIEQIGQIGFAMDLFQGKMDPSKIKYVAYDSRMIHHGSETLFVALRTSRRDGHKYVQEAYLKGVRNFMVDKPLTYRDINFLLCEDTLEALQLWAVFHREQFSYPVIGITGSNGKTIVKEWLSTLLEVQFDIYKSPGSYNSQLGVALSLLQMHPQAELAIIEAGISQRDEMERLWQMIMPDIGILTHLGAAHQAGFVSLEEKIEEKLQLFEGVNTIFSGIQSPSIKKFLTSKQLPMYWVGKEEDADYILRNISKKEDSWKFDVLDKDKLYSFTLPGITQADLENGSLAISVALHLNVPYEDICHQLSRLYPVSMRTEMMTDNPEITLINDSYNSDIDSVRNAFQFLSHISSQPEHKIIISDLIIQGNDPLRLHQEVLAEAVELVGDSNVYTVGPNFKAVKRKREDLSFIHTDELIRWFSYESFRNSTVLIKGARLFELERIVPLLHPKINTSFFQIELQELIHNYKTMTSLLSPDTRVMCMLKAYGYGTGGWEIAQVLERLGATYLAVAYTSEAIELREGNIKLPIMVMNADERSIPALLSYEIEPEIYSLSFLEKYLKAARLSHLRKYRIHLKLETGMGRLGLIENDLPELIEKLMREPHLEVVSVMTHLAAADDPSEDEFTLAQIRKFQEMYHYVQAETGIVAFRHVLNTAGVIRFPEYAMEMVRLGIGLYGINSAQSKCDLPVPLKEIGSLKARISHIQHYEKGTSIGYGRSERLLRDSRIATVPLGYADGIPRKLGNRRGHFLIECAEAPIVGRVCMDMTMVDITDIPLAQLGSEVVCFGEQGEKQISIKDIAQWAETIPYEILVQISPRVRRIYIRE